MSQSSTPAAGEYSPITCGTSSPVDDQKSDDESEYEFVLSAAVSMASGPQRRHSTSSSRASSGGSWVRPLLTRAKSLFPSSLASWGEKKKQRKLEKLASTKEAQEVKEDTGRVMVDFVDPRPALNRTKCKSSPLILINGSFMVGKSAVARDVAQMLANLCVKNYRSKAREMRGGPVEVHARGRVEVLHMNEMYNTIRQICRRSDSSGSSGRSSRSSRGSRNNRSTKNKNKMGPCGCSAACPLAMLDMDKKAMDTFRTETLFESVVSGDRDDVTVIVTDSLPFSEQNSETIQQYRVAARVSDRPFIHIYLICSAAGHMQRLDSRTMSCQAHQLATMRPKKSGSNRDKGKEKAEATGGAGDYVTTRLDELRQQIVAEQEGELRWLPALFPVSRGRTDEGSSSAAGLMQRYVNQFRGFLVDTTDSSIHETALAILGHLNDVQNGVVCTDAEDEDADSIEGPSGVEVAEKLRKKRGGEAECGACTGVSTL